MAVEDAVQLALLLGRLPVDEALAVYTRLRLPRTTAVARRSRRTGRLYSAPYPLQLLTARVLGKVPDRLIARGLDSLLSWEPATAAGP
jgi:2-polyprenyl-6-methoxyphenol hydroxylase-like FAD-dependent oxidoreductase